MKATELAETEKYQYEGRDIQRYTDKTCNNPCLTTELYTAIYSSVVGMLLNFDPLLLKG